MRNTETENRNGHRNKAPQAIDMNVSNFVAVTRYHPLQLETSIEPRAKRTEEQIVNDLGEEVIGFRTIEETEKFYDEGGEIVTRRNKDESGMYYIGGEPIYTLDKLIGKEPLNPEIAGKNAQGIIEQEQIGDFEPKVAVRIKGVNVICDFNPGDKIIYRKPNQAA